MSDTPQQSDSSQENEKKYEFALQLKFYEGQISWQMNVLFVGLNVGIATVLQKELEHLPALGNLTTVLSIAGLIINIFWLGTFLRNNKYYKFRMAQARNAEPKEFSLVNGRGYSFSNGKLVRIPGTNGDDKSKHKLNLFERMCSNKNAIMVSIICFLLGFLLLLILSLFPCH